MSGISPGDTVRITDIHPRDGFFSYLGKEKLMQGKWVVGEVPDNLISEPGYLFLRLSRPGSSETFIFHAIQVEKLLRENEMIEEGDRVKITDIGEHSQFYEDREEVELLGAVWLVDSIIGVFEGYYECYLKLLTPQFELRSFDFGGRENVAFNAAKLEKVTDFPGIHPGDRVRITEVLPGDNFNGAREVPQFTNNTWKVRQIYKKRLDGSFQCRLTIDGNAIRDPDDKTKVLLPNGLGLSFKAVTLEKIGMEG